MTNSSLDQSPDQCFSTGNKILFGVWFTVYLLFLPVFLFVLYIGFNKWKKPQSSASGGLSHSDVYTLHMVAMEMISIIGSCCICSGFASGDKKAIDKAGSAVLIIDSPGRVLFHCLTCVERYLAVVRPVTYLRLRGEGGVTVRNTSSALIWTLTTFCFFIRFLSFFNVQGFFNASDGHAFVAVSGFLVSSASVSLVVFCSVCVLRVLIRPKPGDRGGHRKQIDQSKLSTVYTLAAILGAMLLKLTVQLVVYTILYLLHREVDVCFLSLMILWSALPSSLVLPLLFLHRVKKLPLCR